jgi:hypothetical protein
MSTTKSNSEILADLITHARHTVTRWMKERGGFDHTIFIDGIEGRVSYSPPWHLRSECYDSLAEVARVMCAAYGAKAIVMAGQGGYTYFQAWSGREVNPVELRIKGANEVVALVGETEGELQKLILPTLRSVDGRFRGFGSPVEIPDDDVSNYFHGHLDKIVDDKEERAYFKKLLHEDGHRIYRNPIEAVAGLINDGVSTLMKAANEPRERAALDELFKHTEAVAHGQMSKNREIIPAMVLRTRNNHYIDVPLEQIRACAHRGDVHEVIRSVCVQAGVDAATILLPNTLKAKGQSPDEKDVQQEVAFIIGSTQQIRAERAMPITRAPDGTFTGFAKTWHLPHSHEAEEYQQFIPENGPTQWDREKAEYVLKQAGINISCPCEQGIHHCQENQTKKARGFCR